MKNKKLDIFKYTEDKKMKVFISWSGELSKLVAKELSDWLPSIIQSVEVFYSPEDIQKGENWDSRLTKELEESKYGIVCLTKENVLAPWIHFEAGALANSLDSHVSALMLDVVTSDIKGPLSRFQATKFEKDDFYKLVSDINNASDNPIAEKVLNNSFEAIWDKMNVNIQEIIKTHSSNDAEEKNDETNGILEELLQLLRKQDAVLNNPEKLFPVEYFEYINMRVRDEGDKLKHEVRYMIDKIIHDLYDFTNENEPIGNEIYFEIMRFAKSHNQELHLGIPPRVFSLIKRKLEDLQVASDDDDDE